jgi:hypothetical protein
MTEKCVACGKFIPYAQMVAEGGGAVFNFEPASHYGPEVSVWTCAACAQRPDALPASVTSC